MNNLERDLCNTEWVCNKVKASEAYAQNLYAALCNNSFIKNDVWPLLKGEEWSCTWRYAGGIIASILQEGDYLDWYCSGIRGKEPDNNDTFVSESTVTDEIRTDLLNLGWTVAVNEEEEYY